MFDVGCVCDWEAREKVLEQAGIALAHTPCPLDSDREASSYLL